MNPTYYQWNPENMLFDGSTEAVKNEFYNPAAPGDTPYFYPANSTTLAPPEAPAGKAPRWNGSAWELCDVITGNSYLQADNTQYYVKQNYTTIRELPADEQLKVSGGMLITDDILQKILQGWKMIDGVFTAPAGGGMIIPFLSVKYWDYYSSADHSAKHPNARTLTSNQWYIVFENGMCVQGGMSGLLTGTSDAKVIHTQTLIINITAALFKTGAYIWNTGQSTTLVSTSNTSTTATFVYESVGDKVNGSKGYSNWLVIGIVAMP
jgi:hypothetical protein